MVAGCESLRQSARVLRRLPHYWLLAALLLAGLRAQIQRCHSQCKTCHLYDYSLEWHCMECNEGYDLWVDGCFLPCPLGQYRYGYECEACYENCEECVGPLRHECTKCKNGWTLDYRGMCVEDCGRGYFSKKDGNGCERCSPYCITCAHEYRTGCTKCFPGYTLRVVEPLTQSGECMLDCDSGFFRDSPTDPRCTQCARWCLQCNSLTNCSSCEVGCTLYRGICYNTAYAEVQEGLNFQQYLQSGSGIQWDDSVAPDWATMLAASTEASLNQGQSR